MLLLPCVIDEETEIQPGLGKSHRESDRQSWADLSGALFHLHHTAIRRTDACCPSAEDEDDIVTKCEGRTRSVFPEIYRGLFCPGPSQDGQDIVGASFRLPMVLSSQVN